MHGSKSDDVRLEEYICMHIISLDALYEKHDVISQKIGAFEKAIDTQDMLIDLEKKYKKIRTKGPCPASCLKVFRDIHASFPFGTIPFSNFS